MQTSLRPSATPALMLDDFDLMAVDPMDFVLETHRAKPPTRGTKTFRIS